MQAIEKFLSSNNMEDLQRFQLNLTEWDALTVFQKILAVSKALWFGKVQTNVTSRFHMLSSSSFPLKRH
jgi:hypothetical protein